MANIQDRSYRKNLVVFAFIKREEQLRKMPNIVKEGINKTLATNISHCEFEDNSMKNDVIKTLFEEGLLYYSEDVMGNLNIDDNMKNELKSKYNINNLENGTKEENHIDSQEHS